jgi:hypothetical protein
MYDKYASLRSHARPKGIACPHCGTVNPIKAYCCLSCFKVIQEKQKVPFLAFHARPSMAVLGVVVFLTLVAATLLKAWLATVEAQMTINVKTAEYDLSVVADKKRRQAALHLDKNKESNETAANHQPRVS